MRSVLGALILLTASPASAHITLTSPPARTSQQKQRVCGTLDSVRGTNVTVLRPGSQITVTWTETVPHPGHYRISFDADGQEFSIPPDTTSDTGLTDPNVLMDLIPDVAGTTTYSQVITLPDIECDACTLQLIQMMTDKLPYTDDAASNDIYYQCADITLSATAPMADGPIMVTPDAPGGGGGGGGDGDGGGDGGGDGSSDSTGGCSTTDSPGAGWLAGLSVIGLGLVLEKRRRLRRV